MTQLRLIVGIVVSLMVLGVVAYGWLSWQALRDERDALAAEREQLQQRAELAEADAWMRRAAELRAAETVAARERERDAARAGLENYRAMAQRARRDATDGCADRAIPGDEFDCLRARAAGVDADDLCRTAGVDD